ncbi:MAG: hypothetical protein WC943_12230, partial [Elusimicrobiota bacterium]
MKRSSLWFIPMAALAGLPVEAAVLIRSQAPVNSGVIQAIPALRVNALGPGLTRGASLTLPSMSPGLPNIAAPSITPLAA